MIEEDFDLEAEMVALETMENIEDLIEQQADDKLEKLAKKLKADKNNISCVLKEDSSLPKLKSETCCKGCSNAIWFGNSKIVKCYCSTMMMLTYDSTDMQDIITVCDGVYLNE